MTTEETLLTIDDELRVVLFGLECVLNVEFDPTEVERVFTDSEADQVSVKHYMFFQSRHVTVTGRVDHYEPGTIWLRVESRKPYAPSLQAIVERAGYQIYRLRRRPKIEADANQ